MENKSLDKKLLNENETENVFGGMLYDLFKGKTFYDTYDVQDGPSILRLQMFGGFTLRTPTNEHVRKFLFMRTGDESVMSIPDDQLESALFKMTGVKIG